MKNQTDYRHRMIVLMLNMNLFLLPLMLDAQTRGVGVKIKTNGGEVKQVELYKGSFALVIGNSRYTNGWDSLPGVGTDVAAVKQALETNGFTVETAENLTGDEFTQRVNKFINDYGFESGNRLLIYYAGHGHTLGSTGDQRDLGYIVPVDAPLSQKDELGFKRKAITMDAIQNFAKRIEAKHALFLFDSCFSGKLVSRSAITIPPVIEDKVAFPVRQFITAGAANQTVPDESHFRKAFVRALEGDGDINRDGYMTGTELAEYLKEKVTNYSNRTQTPQYGKINDPELDRGDFVFVVGQASGPAETAANKEPAPADPNAGEKAFWQTIENSTNEQDFKNYLARVESREFSGIYKAAAELILDRLKKEKALANWAKLKPMALGFLKYDTVYKYSDDLAGVSVANGRAKTYGFIDRTGREVIPFKYAWTQLFSEGLAPVQIADGKKFRFSYIDKTGREVITLGTDTEQPSSFSEGLALVKLVSGQSRKWKFIDTKGRDVLSNNYGFVRDFSESLAVFKTVSGPTGKWGYIDKTGREVITLEYNWAGNFSEGLARVGNTDGVNGNFGYIDKTGQTVIPLKYQDGGDFSEGLAAVRIGDWKTGKYGYIDKTGREVIPFNFDWAGAFSNGVAPFTIGTGNTAKHGYIDKTGQVVIPAKYDGVWSWAFQKEGIYGMVLNGRKGFVDIYGHEFFDF